VRRLVCSVAGKLSFSVPPRVALPFPPFALFTFLTCVQLRLTTILGNRGCVAVPVSLGCPRPCGRYGFVAVTALPKERAGQSFFRDIAIINELSIYIINIYSLYV
jgi:hypothetical protein